MIKLLEGNILNSDCNIICQQVNCKGVMGRGLALEIANRYPELKRQYIEICHTNNRHLIGTVFYYAVNSRQYIANLFTQNNYGTQGVYTDYKALEKAIIDIKNTCLMNSFSVALPYKIGCGLGGGNWDTVYSIIMEAFEDSNILCKLYKYK